MVSLARAGQQGWGGGSGCEFFEASSLRGPPRIRKPTSGHLVASPLRRPAGPSGGLDPDGAPLEAASPAERSGHVVEASVRSDHLRAPGPDEHRIEGWGLRED